MSLSIQNPYRLHAKERLKIAFLNLSKQSVLALNTLTVSKLAKLAGINRVTFYDGFENIPDFIKWFLHKDLIFQIDDTPLSIEVSLERILTFIDHHRLTLNHLVHSSYKDIVLGFIEHEAMTYQLSNFSRIDLQHIFSDHEKRFVSKFYASGLTSIIVQFILLNASEKLSKDHFLSLSVLLVRNYIEELIAKRNTEIRSTLQGL